MVGDFNYFNEHIKKNMSERYSFCESEFKDGQFGDLRRVEFTSPSRIGGLDFWSTGWLSIHLVDLDREEELLNVLLSPDDNEKAKEALGKMLSLI